MQAADVMTVGMASIAPDAPVEEAARLMLLYRISGLPVIDATGALVGLVTEGDLLRRDGASDAYPRPRWLEFLFGSDRPEASRPAGERTVASVMTQRVVTVETGTPVSEIADIMENFGIKRVPVLEGAKVVGIVSRADLLRGLARQGEQMRSASAADQALRVRVLESLEGASSAWRSLNVSARDGVVTLRGATFEAGDGARLEAAAKGVSGVSEVKNRLVVVGRESGG